MEIWFAEHDIITVCASAPVKSNQFVAMTEIFFFNPNHFMGKALSVHCQMEIARERKKGEESKRFSALSLKFLAHLHTMMASCYHVFQIKAQSLFPLMICTICTCSSTQQPTYENSLSTLFPFLFICHTYFPNTLSLFCCYDAQFFFHFVLAATAAWFKVSFSLTIDIWLKCTFKCHHLPFFPLRLHSITVSRFSQKYYDRKISATHSQRQRQRER